MQHSGVGMEKAQRRNGILRRSGAMTSTPKGQITSTPKGAPLRGEQRRAGRDQ
jgi:hypothetical protein